MLATFGQILDAVLAANLERQVAADRYRATMSAKQWLEEFGTVQLGYGRGIGKTTTIGMRATSKDLVITHNQGMMRVLMESKIYFPTVITQDDVKFDKHFWDRKYDRIWVDESSLFNNLDLVLERGVETKVRQIILIG